MLCVTLQSIVSPWALRWCFSIQTSGSLWSSKVFLIAHSFRVEKPFSSCFQLLMFILKHHFHLVSTVASREQHTGGGKKNNYFSPCVELSAIRTIQNNKMSQIRQDSKCVWWSCSNVEKGCQAPKTPCHVWWKSLGLFPQNMKKGCRKLWQKAKAKLLWIWGDQAWFASDFKGTYFTGTKDPLGKHQNNKADAKMKWQTDGVNVDKDIWSKHRWLAYQFQIKHTVKAALVTQNSHRKTEAGRRWMDC